MTRIPAVLLTAAALSLPAAPAFAIGAHPCPSGEIGVVVVDGNGELAEACVRRDEVDAALERARETVDPIRNCPPTLLLPGRIYTQGDLIVVEGGPDEYFRCIRS